MTMAVPSKILVIRNDKLGDFSLSLPTFALLKHCMPHIEVHALVPEYTRPVAELCPYIDKIIIDPSNGATPSARYSLYQTLNNESYNAALTLYSTSRIGLILSRLRIPVRVAPATKLAQVFYNHRLRQRRSQSKKPEYAYNLDLGRHLLKILDSDCDFIPKPPYLHVSENEVRQLKQEFYSQHGIHHDKLLLFVHPGSGGSANNLSTDQYALLANHLAKHKNYHIVLTAGPGEYEIAHRIASQLTRSEHCIYESRQGLSNFVKHIAFCDAFISGSTGPLHVAGALNRPTVGFYTNRQSATSLRWETLSTDDRRLAFSPPATAAPEDMASVDLNTAMLEIQKMLGRLY